MPTPEITERPAQPYVAISAQVTMQTLADILPKLMPPVFAWLSERGIPPAGAPFWRYDLIDMDRALDVEVGVPVAAPVTGDGEVLAGTLPAGRYVTVRHTGHPDGLYGATESLVAWAAERNLAWDMTVTPDGEKWAARLEIYETDPAVEPDMTKWTTRLAFRLRD